jgi:hypothetical protein
MHTRLRSTVAAVLLLAPVAASFLAQPASAATAAAAPAITNMSINSDAGLSPGATLRVQVTASRDTRSASVALGDSGVVVPLRQQSPGNYSGTYVVSRKDRIDPMQMMTARVTAGTGTVSRQFNFPAGFQALAMGASDRDGPDRRNTARVDPRVDPRYAEPEGDYRIAARERGRDERSPDITELMPANGDRIGAGGRIHVRAHLSDEASGIDPATVRLRLNGEDVTAESRVTPDEVHFRGDLPPGRYTAEVTARDQVGNRTRKAWTFDVVPGGEPGFEERQSFQRPG